MMAITTEAIYEGGFLRLAHPLPLDEHQRVHVTVHPEPTVAEQTAGLMGWRGSADEAEYFASSPELDFPPPAEET
jgi:predicted DNA-binding antitoxin AbrB/MazE fold protein